MLADDLDSAKVALTYSDYAKVNARQLADLLGV